MADGAVHLLEVQYFLVELDPVGNDMCKSVQRQIERDTFASLDLERCRDPRIRCNFIECCSRLDWASSSGKDSRTSKLVVRAPETPGVSLWLLRNSREIVEIR
jgi:hypothetical protein